MGFTVVVFQDGVEVGRADFEVPVAAAVEESQVAEVVQEVDAEVVSGGEQSPAVTSEDAGASKETGAETAVESDAEIRSKLRRHAVAVEAGDAEVGVTEETTGSEDVVVQDAVRGDETPDAYFEEETKE